MEIMKQYQWIQGFLIVIFDIEQGQKIEMMIPNKLFNKLEQNEIAMLSFPDSNSLDDHQGTMKYIFKLKNGMFGYNCFKQKKDQNNSRGYSQKSLVIISNLPFVHFYLQMTQQLVFKLFQYLNNIQQELNKAYQQILKWPQPQPLKEYILPLLNYQLKILIPNYTRSIENNKIMQISLNNFNTQQQYSLEQIVTQQALLRSGEFQEIKLIQHFGICHEILWSLWQAVMLNKSILILGTNPYNVSCAVLGSISLINPFIYIGDYNPYITIYDRKFNDYQQKNKQLIIGGTNPLFHKIFNHQITTVIELISQFRCKKTIKPQKQLLLKCQNEQQRAINQSSVRKYFYRLSRSVMKIIEDYLDFQRNDLKFFNNKEFIVVLKDKKNYYGLENVFSRKKYLFAFFEQFLMTSNFNYFLKHRNAIRLAVT